MIGATRCFGRTTMIFTVMLLSILFLSSSDAYSQRLFPYQFTLDSRSADTLFTPDATSARHRYRVTAWGTYSMWEDTINSSVDPLWIYSFPDEEWAKPEWRLFSEGYPIYVGDSRLFDSHGLRVNDAPFPSMPLNMTDHRYSMIIRGNGLPVSTSIVDWNFRDFVIRDAHDNNSGFLHVLVEELPLTEMSICAIDSSRFPAIRVSLKVLRDSVQIDDIAQRLTIREGGIDVPIDSVDCAERTRPVSIAMVFDRSGSMTEPWGGSDRMEETKRAGRSFVDRLSDIDEAAIYSFSDDVTLDQSWTSNRTLLRNAINRLDPEGYTAMNDGVDRALTDIENRPSIFKKGVVVLSDGADNISRITAISEVIAHANRIDVPVFAIGLLLDDDDSLRALAAQTGGAYFSVSDASAIDSVFGRIAELLFEKGCCNVWYTSPNTARDGTMRMVETDVTFVDDTVVTNVDGYQAPSSSTGVELDQMNNAELTILFDLIGSPATLSLTTSAARQLSGHVRVVDLLGREVLAPQPVRIAPGRAMQMIPLGELATGSYLIRFESDGIVRQQVVMIRR